MAAVRFEQVDKVFPDGTRAVDGLTLTINDGEFVTVVGPSGCGKTTALRMLAGFEGVTKGSIWIGDRIVSDLEPRARGVAMVFQNYALYPHMSVRQNIAFPLRRLKEMSKADIARTVHQTAELLGLEDLLDRRPHELSGGQKQRVAIGRALVRRPDVFVMDEPLSNLDASLRVQMRVELKRLHERLRVTTLFVTHDQTEAMTLGDRVAVMRDGVLQQVGTAHELYHAPENLFVAKFIGSPPMNLIDAGLEAGQLTVGQAGALVAQSESVARRNLPGSAVTIGIRPEDLYTRKAIDDALNGKLVARVVQTEVLGPEALIYFDIDGDGTDVGILEETYVARVSSSEVIPTPGQRIELWFDINRLYFFDPMSGQRLVDATTQSSHP